MKYGVVAVITALLVCTAGCAVNSAAIYPATAPTRPALDAPDHFMVGTIEPGGPLTEPQAHPACRNPMVDPRDGTRLTLVQSQPSGRGQIGDYQVPDGRYAVRSGELLRLECGTGVAIGVIPPRS